MAESSSNVDFEALIDLLGTDDVDENEAGPSSAPFAPVTNLRRPDGRFDFNRIKTYFEVNARGSSEVSLVLPTLFRIFLILLAFRRQRARLGNQDAHDHTMRSQTPCCRPA